MMTTALLLLASAFAAEPAAVTQSVAESQSLDLYAFSLAACDAIRAEIKDTRPADAPRSMAVIVELRNETDSSCVYQGVVLKGFLAGVYTISAQDASGGFTVPPMDSLRLRITPDDAGAARGGVQLQIPPEKGIVVLIGLAPEAAPAPAPVAPAPAAEPAPAKPAKGRGR